MLPLHGIRHAEQRTSKRLRAGCVTVLCLALIACGGGGGGSSSAAGSSNNGVALTCPGASQTTGAQVTVSGQITYERIPPAGNGSLDYNNIQTLPSRSLLVAAIDGSGNQLASDITDNDGNYALSVNDQTCIKIRAYAKTQQDSGSTASWNFEVTDNTGDYALYAMEGSLSSSGTSNSTRNLLAPAGWNGISYGERVAAPFAIIDTIFTGISKIIADFPDTNFPTGKLHWSPNNQPVPDGDLELGEIGTSFFTSATNSIYLLGQENVDTDEYDEHLILHEWGHYIENVFSRSDSLGGSHRIDDRLDLRVAFGEGWANAWSAIAADNPIYSDASGTQQQAGFTFNIENNSPTNRGWFNESSVHSIIYDIYDDANEAGDPLNLALAPILTALTSTDYTEFDGASSLYAFLEVLRQQEPTAVSGIDNLKNNQFIAGTGFYGSGENNGSGAVPVYYSLTAGGGPVTACSNNDHGEYNKLQNRRLFLLNVPSTRSYSVSVSTASAERLPTDPDVIIWRKGVFIESFESGLNNNENGSVNLSAGNYLLELYDFYNIDEDKDGPTGGQACFNIQVF